MGESDYISIERELNMKNFIKNVMKRMNKKEVIAWLLISTGITIEWMVGYDTGWSSAEERFNSKD